MADLMKLLQDWWTNWLMYIVLGALSAFILGIAAKAWWRLILWGWRMIP